MNRFLIFSPLNEGKTEPLIYFCTKAYTYKRKQTQIISRGGKKNIRSRTWQLIFLQFLFSSREKNNHHKNDMNTPFIRNVFAQSTIL